MKRTKNRKEPFVQYSKRMCTRVTFFWMLYRLANFIVVLLRPEVSKYLVDLCTGVDTVMIVNIGFYAGNSISEKGFRAFFNRKSIYSYEETSIDNEDYETSGTQTSEDDIEKDNG